MRQFDLQEAVVGFFVDSVLETCLLVVDHDGLDMPFGGRAAQDEREVEELSLDGGYLENARQGHLLWRDDEVLPLLYASLKLHVGQFEVYRPLIAPVEV